MLHLNSQNQILATLLLMSLSKVTWGYDVHLTHSFVYIGQIFCTCHQCSSSCKLCSGCCCITMDGYRITCFQTWRSLLAWEITKQHKQFQQLFLLWNFMFIWIFIFNSQHLVWTMYCYTIIAFKICCCYSVVLLQYMQPCAYHGKYE